MQEEEALILQKSTYLLALRTYISRHVRDNIKNITKQET